MSVLKIGYGLGLPMFNVRNRYGMDIDERAILATQELYNEKILFGFNSK